jgi:hypothetical protein
MRRTIPIVCSLLVGAAFAAGAEGGSHASGSSSGTVPPPAQTKQSMRLPTGKLAIEQLPEPVKHTLLRESDGRSISDIEGKEKDGKIEYRAKFRDSRGVKTKIRIHPDGSLVDTR